MALEHMWLCRLVVMHVSNVYEDKQSYFVSLNLSVALSGGQGKHSNIRRGTELTHLDYMKVMKGETLVYCGH